MAVILASQAHPLLMVSASLQTNSTLRSADADIEIDNQNAFLDHLTFNFIDCYNVQLSSVLCWLWLLMMTLIPWMDIASLASK